MPKMLVTLALILIFFTTTLAKAFEILTLDEAISLATEQNFDVNGIRKNINIAKENIKYANRLQNPFLQATYNTGASGDGNNNQIGIALPIEVLKRSARKAKALAEKSGTESQVELSVFMLKMDVREAYIRFAAAKSVLNVVRQQKESILQTLNIAKKRFEVGVAPEVEHLQAKIVFEQLGTVYNESQAQVSIMQYFFNKTLGVDENSEYDIIDAGLPEDGDFIGLKTPSPKDPVLPYEEIEKIALAHRLDIEIAQKEIEIAKKSLTIARRQIIPDVGIIAAYSYIPGAKNYDPVTAGQTLNGAFLAAGMEFPVLYTFRPEVNIAKSQLEQKELALHSVRTAAIANVKSAYTAFSVARKNLNFYLDGLLKESEIVLKASKKSYEVGKSDLSTLILMQQARLNILTGYVESLTNYYCTWIDLLRAMNVESI